MHKDTSCMMWCIALLVNDWPAVLLLVCTMLCNTILPLRSWKQKKRWFCKMKHLAEPPVLRPKP